MKIWSRAQIAIASAVAVVAALVGGGVVALNHHLGSTAIASPAVVASSPPPGPTPVGSDPVAVPTDYLSDAQAALARAQADLDSLAAQTLPPVPTVTVTAPPVEIPGPTVTETETATATVTATPSPAPTVTVTVTPTPSPSPSPSSTPAARPGPSNTGVPAGTQLTVMNADLTITTAGATYSGLDIHGYVVVKAPNVTIKNSIIRGGVGKNGNGIVNDTSAAATNFLLEDSEVVPQFPVVNLDDVKGWNYTLLRDNIHGSVDGLKMYGDNATVQDSWVHDLVTYPVDAAQGGGPSHSDGVQILSGHNLRVIGNTIIGQPNSSIIITQDNGAVGNVLISGNWLGSQGSGQICTVLVLNKPLPALTGITITGNRFLAPLARTCQILDSKAVTLVLSGNVIDATGAAAKFLNTAAV